MRLRIAKMSSGPTSMEIFCPKACRKSMPTGSRHTCRCLRDGTRTKVPRNFGPPEKPTPENLRALAMKRFGPRAQEFLNVYAASNDAEALRVAEDFAGDAFIAYSTWAWLEAQAKTGDAPVYRYRFDLGSPGDPNHPAAIGAFHSDDIEYVFGTLDSRQGAKWRPEDYKLSELMQNYWTNFSKTGDPNSSGLPQWPTYNEAGNWQVMHLSPDPEVRPDRHRDRYLFLQQVWGADATP